VTKNPASLATGGYETEFTRVRRGHMDIKCPLKCGLWYIEVLAVDDQPQHWFHEIDEPGEIKCPLFGHRTSAINIASLITILSNKEREAAAAMQVEIAAAIKRRRCNRDDSDGIIFDSAIDSAIEAAIGIEP